MVSVIIWAIGFIVTFYIQYQANWYKVKEYANRKGEYNHYIDSLEFWIIILKSVFWYIWIIIYVIWVILDRTIGKKYFGKKSEKNISESKAIAIIEELLQRPDILMDAITNENTNYDAETLYHIGKENLK